MKNIFTLSVFILSLFTVFVANAQSTSPDGAKVYIISPMNGETLTSPVNVKFGLSGMGVAPAGFEKANTGHHHLIVNGSLPEMGMPMGKGVKHFGGGQTETTLELKPGKHTLQLVLGDHLHIPHNPPVISEKIEIVVE